MFRRSQRIKKRSQDAKASANRGASTTLSRPRRGQAFKANWQPPTPSTQTSPSDDAAKLETVARAPSKRGMLFQMLEMPLDVIMEICVHLQTKDMLHLSRLTKDFRAFFTSRSTQPIWKAARLNVPRLPSCPDDLTELAYAHLLFDPSCHNCPSRNCHSVYWGCRVRLCKKCYNELSVSLDYRSRQNYHLYDHTTIRLLNDQDTVSVLVPPLGEPSWADANWIQYRPLLDKFVLTWKATPEESRDQLIKKQVHSTVAIVNTVPALRKWYDDFRRSRADELEDIREARRDAIIENLKKDGWGPEVEYMSDTSDEQRFMDLPGVWKPQALTPRIWNAIRGRIIELMLEIRPKRLHDLYIYTLRNRLTVTNKLIQEIVSEMQDVQLTPREIAISSRKFYDLVDPQNEGFNVGDMRVTLQLLVQNYLEEREGHARKALLDMIREETGLKGSSDPFSLAIGSYFTCFLCRQVFACRNAAHHTCQHPWGTTPPLQEWMLGDYYYIVEDWFSSNPGYQEVWDAEIFRARLKPTAEAIKACGFDLNTATVEDLDKDSDLRFVFTDCLRVLQCIPIMNWKTAVSFHSSLY
ncbi:hypothetical protein BDY19DRAFT_108541 [Irpex rosettiformis]|uniref:Uncharacterized protein n=1 Tax=Irpex rosettiformis TaxID=378272 RepID=A0ACB8U5H6_9APHY|nr:hypothetical protein BDY19DRAFT_108541 [Irpex rosettiformis]